MGRTTRHKLNRMTLGALSKVALHGSEDEMAAVPPSAQERRVSQSTAATPYVAIAAMVSEVAKRRDCAGCASLRESELRSSELRASDHRSSETRSTRIIPGSTMLTSLVSSARRKRIPARVPQAAGLRGALRALR